MIPAPAASLAEPDAFVWKSRLAKLCPAASLTIIGLDAADLAAAQFVSGAPLLRLDLTGVVRSEVAIARIIDDLADLAFSTWPAWPPSVFQPWRRAADRLAAAGRPPRFSKRVPNSIQFEALYPAAGTPILVFSLDPTRSERAAAFIAALEWAGRHGAATVALLPEMPPLSPPWDRILYGALAVAPSRSTSASARVLSSANTLPPGASPRGSYIERRIRAALADTDDLTGLFEDEVTLRLGTLGLTPRVDMLWREGKVVVELDGTEHERDPNYGADRHRDYELLVAGYLVLRLTNAEIDLDLARSIEKIRRVVNLRRTLA